MLIQCTCFTCGKVFPRKPCHVARGSKRSYCSHHCRSLIGPLDPVSVQEDGTALITLRNRDWQIVGHAVIDGADADLVGDLRWFLGNTGYAEKRVNRRVVSIHRMILGLTYDDGLEGDHINRDRLDNRRANLRIVTKGQNSQNKGSQPGSTSAYRGVSWSKRSCAWIVQVMTGRKNHRFGPFSDEHEAGRVAKEARARLMPYSVN